MIRNNDIEMNDREKNIAEMYGSIEGYKSLDDYSKALLANKYAIMEGILGDLGDKKVDLSEFRTVEDCDVLGDFEEMVDYDIEYVSGNRLLEKSPPKLENDTPMQSSLLSTLGCIGIESTCFVQHTRFQPFSRQHRVLHEIGPLVRNSDFPLEMVFPPVGYEWFTNQFKSSLGILSSCEGVIALTTVSNIMYSVQPLRYGSEYVVFQVRDYGGVVTSYLWDSERIVEVKAAGPSYGTYERGVYSTLYGVVFRGIKDNIDCREPCHFWPTQNMFETPNVRGYLCNINGVDYAIPRERWVCLTNRDGRMCDATHKEYPVDRVATRNGLYRIDSPYKFVRDTEQKADSMKAVAVMKDSVIVHSDFMKFFKIPRGGCVPMKDAL